ncbi:hypothetical protein EVAR_9164_1 [Eumeta japonica]|uniref:Uncharacterized protein n=1 Tax=Eumeta variegata TaxID=151549 RepID=A0A4C1TWC5_EUMVA|nr:hypothetical protein EVAR_9164_1 [Eumeta japonica]
MYNARNSTALNCLRTTQCAGPTLPDPSFFSPVFSQRQSLVRCTELIHLQKNYGCVTTMTLLTKAESWKSIDTKDEGIHYTSTLAQLRALVIRARINKKGQNNVCRAS